jgi:integrase
MPDPLDEAARARALSPKTVRLRRDHVHSAVSAAVAAGVEVQQLHLLADLVEEEAFKSLLRHRWVEDGRKLSAYTHGVAGTLIAIANQWTRAPAESVTRLKALRRKLGALRSGLTDKNQSLLRKFDNPQAVGELIHLPEKLWRRARRELPSSRRAFIDLQTALAIDLLLHVPLRMMNLSSLSFMKHLHWPQGRGRPALLTFADDETKNRRPLSFELDPVLADRLAVYRNEIAPAVIGLRPDEVFMGLTGRRRTQAAITVSIEKAVLKHTGIKLTPHQFRHFAAKLRLDENPCAGESLKQLLGHTSEKTTNNFYAGQDTRRAGRAHTKLVLQLREDRMRQGRGRARSTPKFV